MSRSVRFNLASADAPEKGSAKNDEKGRYKEGIEDNVFGTSGLHFIALQKVTRRIRQEYIEVKKDLGKGGIENGSNGGSDLVILKVRALHLKTKLKILEEVRQASEHQLVVEADKRLERERKQMEMQRSMHSAALDPEQLRMARLDRETWGDHEANEKRKERKKRERAEMRERRAEENAKIVQKSKKEE